jgi:hypothetical protein
MRIHRRNCDIPYLQSTGVGADDLADLLSIFEQEKSRHSTDTELCRDVIDLIHVHFVEVNVWVVLRERNNFWGDQPAGTCGV